MTNQAIDANQLIMGTGARSAAFKDHGDRVWGTIMSAVVKQQTDFTTQKPKFYDDGDPMLHVIITLLTDLSEDDEDDGMRAVYAKGQMLKAIRNAVSKAGAKGIAEGGRLVVQYTGDAEPKQKGMSGAKQYFAKYEPPTSPVELSDEPDIDDDLLPF